MIRELLLFQWKELRRSIIRRRNVAGGILTAMTSVSISAFFLSIGMIIYPLITFLRPFDDPLYILNKYLFYFFIADLCLRFLFQRIPSQIIEPYRHLPIKRSVLVHILLTKSFFSVFNVLPLFLFVPFAIRVIDIRHAGLTVGAWMAIIMILTACNSLINFYFNKQFIANPKVTLILPVVALTIALLDYFHVVSLSVFSGYLFGAVFHSLLPAAGALAILVFMYLLNYSFFLYNIYTEDLQSTAGVRHKSSTEIRFLDRFGGVGQFITLELKLIVRNKRSRAFMLMSIVPLVSALTLSVIMFGNGNAPVSSSTPMAASAKTFPVQKQVVFHVTADHLPEDAIVYITGNNDQLGNWNADKIPLERQDDSDWVRPFAFPPGIDLQYKLTLGSWGSEALGENGRIPDNSHLQVERDTIVMLHIASWKSSPPEKLLQAKYVDLFYLYLGLLLTGSVMYMYGRFVIVWENGYFDLILSRKIEFAQYFKAKFLLMLVSGLFFYVLMLPLAFYNRVLMCFITVALLYNCGVNSFALLFLATYSRSRFDLDAGVMSAQGKGVKKYTVFLISSIPPMMLFLTVCSLFSREIAAIVVAGLGAAGLLFHGQLLRIVSSKFNRQKYKIAVGFRQ